MDVNANTPAVQSKSERPFFFGAVWRSGSRNCPPLFAALGRTSAEAGGVDDGSHVGLAIRGPHSAVAVCDLALNDSGPEGSFLFGVLRSSAFELCALLAFDVFRGSLLLFGIGCLALPPWDQ